jgi:hypothetical protein
MATAGEATPLLSAAAPPSAPRHFSSLAKSHDGGIWDWIRPLLSLAGAAAVCAALASTALGIAVVGPDWLLHEADQGGSNSFMWGLWQLCTRGDADDPTVCRTYFEESAMKDNFGVQLSDSTRHLWQTAGAFCLLSFLLLLVAHVCWTLGFLRRLVRLKRVAFGCALAALLTLVITLACVGGIGTHNDIVSDGSENGKVSWAFAYALVALVLALAAAMAGKLDLHRHEEAYLMSPDPRPFAPVLEMYPLMTHVLLSLCVLVDSTGRFAYNAFVFVFVLSHLRTPDRSLGWLALAALLLSMLLDIVVLGLYTADTLRGGSLADRLALVASILSLLLKPLTAFILFRSTRHARGSLVGLLGAADHASSSTPSDAPASGGESFGAGHGGAAGPEAGSAFSGATSSLSSISTAVSSHTSTEGPEAKKVSPPASVTAPASVASPPMATAPKPSITAATATATIAPISLSHQTSVTVPPPPQQQQQSAGASSRSLPTPSQEAVSVLPMQTAQSAQSGETTRDTPARISVTDVTGEGQVAQSESDGTAPAAIANTTPTAVASTNPAAMASTNPAAMASTAPLRTRRRPKPIVATAVGPNAMADIFGEDPTAPATLSAEPAQGVQAASSLSSAAPVPSGSALTAASTASVFAAATSEATPAIAPSRQPDVAASAALIPAVTTLATAAVHAPLTASGAASIATVPETKAVAVPSDQQALTAFISPPSTTSVTTISSSLSATAATTATTATATAAAQSEGAADAPEPVMLGDNELFGGPSLDDLGGAAVAIKGKKKKAAKQASAEWSAAEEEQELQRLREQARQRSATIAAAAEAARQAEEAVLRQAQRERERQSMTDLSAVPANEGGSKKVDMEVPLGITKPRSATHTGDTLLSGIRRSLSSTSTAPLTGRVMPDSDPPLSRSVANVTAPARTLTSPTPTSRPPRELRHTSVSSAANSDDPGYPCRECGAVFADMIAAEMHRMANHRPRAPSE